MKSQAKGLATKGEDVTYIFLEGSIGGPEAIMSLANKQEMSELPQSPLCQFKIW